MRGAPIFAALVALLVAAFASAPDASAAKVLSIAKATEVTRAVAERDCRRDENCEAANATNCRRLAPRRVSCVASNVGTDAEGAYQCDRLVIVRRKSGGGTRHAAGRPSCYRV
jgi:hypothetical protein